MNKGDFTFLVSSITALVIFAWITFLCGLLGIFYTPLIWILWGCSTGILYYKKYLPFPMPSQNLIVIIGISTCIALSLFFISEPSIFSGRDQGSIADAAHNLHKNHTLQINSSVIKTFFEIYGPGQALNFPGFHYTNMGTLTTQFPLPYITFLAGFMGTFGAKGITVANSILLIFFLTVVTTVSTICVGKKWSPWLLGLLITIFPTLWFAKFSLSENLAGVLFWASIVIFLTGKDRTTKNPHTAYLAFFLSTGLLFFVRIEGILLASVLFVLFLRRKKIRLAIKKYSHTVKILAITSTLMVSTLTLLMSTPFYKTMLKAAFGQKNEGAAQSAAPLAENTFTNILMPIYWSYGLLLPLIFTALALIIFTIQKKKHTLALIVAVCFPLFLYYFDPQISNDHPWMLRRFSWLLLPLTLLGTITCAHILSTRLKNKIPSMIALGTLIFLFLFQNAPLIPFAQNKDLATQIGSFAEQFETNDLILLAPEVTGDGWSMIDAPLRNIYKKNAVYFFNENDYPKLNTSAFKRVFLVVPTHQSELYSNLTKDRTATQSITFQTKKLHKSKIIDENLRKLQTITTHNDIYQLK